VDPVPEGGLVLVELEGELGHRASGSIASVPAFSRASYVTER
jgi:hypothetical protein